MLLLLLACGYPDAPPPLPSVANTMDTARFSAPVDGAPERRETRERVVQGKASLSQPVTKKAPAELLVDGTVVEVLWKVNDKVINGATARSLDPMWFKPGDRITASVVISDGSARSTLETAAVKVENSPPEFTVDQRDFTQIQGFVVAAQDPDGDPLVWSLRGGPPGMSVDPETGTLSYQASNAAEGGSYKARIVVKDPSGAKAVWPLTLDVAAGQEAGVKRRYGGGED